MMISKASPSPSEIEPKTRNVTSLMIASVISAVFSLIVLPELFVSIAFVLGAYVWRIEKDEKRNRGLMLIILGIICMIIGIYFTAYFELGDLFF